jgi:hypothetical protein
VTDYADKSKKTTQPAEKKTEDSKSVQTKSADTNSDTKKKPAVKAN